MKNQSFVKAKCSINNKDFAITFVEVSGEAWEAQKTFELTETRAKTGFGKTPLNRIYIGPGYSGCPWCKNLSFFLCNNCKTLNCQGSAKKHTEGISISCATCGLTGYLKGTIEMLDGYRDI